MLDFILLILSYFSFARLLRKIIWGIPIDKEYTTWIGRFAFGTLDIVL